MGKELEKEISLRTDKKINMVGGIQGRYWKFALWAIFQFLTVDFGN